VRAGGKPVAVPDRSWHCGRVPKVTFDERIAARYETYWPELFEPEVIDGRVQPAGRSLAVTSWATVSGSAQPTIHSW
jgi:hypothetical protein